MSFAGTKDVSETFDELGSIRYAAEGNPNSGSQLQACLRNG